jgi:hypothetical protein
MSIEHTLLPAEEYENFHDGWRKTADQLADLLNA